MPVGRLSVEPRWALPGAPVLIRGALVPLPTEGLPHVLVGAHDARVTAASRRGIRIIVPAGAEGGSMTVRVDELPGEASSLEVGRQITTGVHQVDSPLFDRQGRLYATQSGGRDTRAAAPLYRVGLNGVRESLSVEIANPTSLALGPDGLVYVSSRFDGNVYRLTAADHVELYAAELGVPTGLAFAPDGTLFVGDRSGSIFRVSPDRQVETFASLPSSVAAFHLAYGPDSCLYVTAPTFSTRDGIYRITMDRLVTTAVDGFGRPQGMAFAPSGALYVVDALAGAAALYRVDVSKAQQEPVRVLSAPALVGVAVDPAGGIVLASNDTIWKLDVEV